MVLTLALPLAPRPSGKSKVNQYCVILFHFGIPLPILKDKIIIHMAVGFLVYS